MANPWLTLYKSQEQIDYIEEHVRLTRDEEADFL
jgi:hypothetical protein